MMLITISAALWAGRLVIVSTLIIISIVTDTRACLPLPLCLPTAAGRPRRLMATTTLLRLLLLLPLFAVFLLCTRVLLLLLPPRVTVLPSPRKRAGRCSHLNG